MQRLMSILFMFVLLSHAHAHAHADANVDAGLGERAVVKLQVQVNQTGPTINRHIFGQFAEHLGRGIYEGVWVGDNSDIPNVRGIRSDVVKALKDIKVPNIRWPGGCYAEEYHWQDGVGKASERKARLNVNWGNVIEPNSFGTHEFLDFTEQVGAEAYISANVGSGTVQEAADWLEYMTAEQTTALALIRKKNGRDKPFRVAFWGIGNESWGCGGALSADDYLMQLKRFSRFSRNLDPSQTMQQIAVGPDGDNTQYTETIMSAWSSKTWSWDIQGLSLHKYTLNGWPPSRAATDFGVDDYVSMLSETLSMEDTINLHATIMDKYDPEKKVALVVDEWGAWLAPTLGSNPGFLEQQNSLRDAILAALNLNIFIRHAGRVRMTNIAQMVNVLQAMILTDGAQMLLTPTYYIYQMYMPFQDATFIPVVYESGQYHHGDTTLPQLDVIAAKDKQGVLWLAATNIDPTNNLTLELDIAGVSLQALDGHSLTAGKVDSINIFSRPQNVVPSKISAVVTNNKLRISLAAKSVSVFSIKGSAK